MEQFQGRRQNVLSNLVLCFFRLQVSSDIILRSKSRVIHIKGNYTTRLHTVELAHTYAKQLLSRLNFACFIWWDFYTSGKLELVNSLSTSARAVLSFVRSSHREDIVDNRLYRLTVIDLVANHNRNCKRLIVLYLRVLS